MILFLLSVVSSWELNIGRGPRLLLERSPSRHRRLAEETPRAGGRYPLSFCFIEPEGFSLSLLDQAKDPLNPRP